jgi:hypothetical protein
MRNKNIFILFMTVMLIPMLSACYDVQEGYRVDYAESPAELNINSQSVLYGAIGDTISFTIQAQAESDIKSMIVSSTVSGKEGTGFYIPEGKTDPLIDHTYGTIKKGTRDFDLVYNYIVAQDTSDVTISFSLIDNDGKKTKEFKINTVPSIVTYKNVVLYTNSSSKTDGFSSADGVVYTQLANYEAVTAANQIIQKSIDIIFLVSNGSAILAGPYDWYFSSNMKVRNKTKFKILKDVSSNDFNNLSNGTLSSIVEKNQVGKGSTNVSNIEVGDFIGYKTDFASTNSYKFGIIRINSIHPANCDWYQGKSYLIDMDVVSQINKK